MIWIVLALVVAFATVQSLVIERLWRDQRRTRNEMDELFEQVDALAVAVDRQVLTQEQINDQIKPVAQAIRESNQVVVETMDSLVGTVREAKAERRKLRDLIAKTGAALPVDETPGAGADTPDPIDEILDQPAPISWPDTNGRLDITAAARKQGRSRSEVALAQRLGRTMPVKKRVATG